MKYVDVQVHNCMFSYSVLCSGIPLNVATTEHPHLKSHFSLSCDLMNIQILSIYLIGGLNGEYSYII